MLDVEATQQTLDASPFGPWWGFQVESVNTGHARVRLPARPELFRPGGVLQGGCAMTLADVTFWAAIMGTIEAGEAAVTLGQTSTFLSAARTDLICDAELLRTGRAVLYGTATVRDARDTLVTHHTLTYMRPPTPARAPDQQRVE